MEESAPRPKKKRRIGRFILLLALIGGGYYIHTVQTKNNASVVAELTKKADAEHSAAPQAEATPAPGDPTKSMITASVVDISQISQISKYRSGAISDYSQGNDETCRALRHTFTAGSEPVAVSAPVSGVISSLTPLTITPTNFPRLVVKLEGVTLTPTITENSSVQASQVLGSIPKNKNLSIAIEMPAGTRTDYFSYFDVMPDSLFLTYAQNGLKSRQQVIVDRALRDTKPFTCENGKFTNHDVDDPGDWLALTPQ